jgi:calcineurin-like phosphoesterase family protein
VIRFRDDIDLDTTYVTSDTHFGHDNIVGFCHRPEDHEQVMIAEWRKVAKPGITMLHLGDLTYRSNARFKALTSKELTGPGLADRNLLIKGNHDGQRFSYYKDCGFKLARPFALKLAGPGDGRLEVVGSEAWPYSAPSRHYIVSFSHYAWGLPDDEGEMNLDPYKGGIDWRIHGHIHNNGYQRSSFVPFLRNHINVSVEQTGYKPVLLRTLLEAAILGVLPATQAEEDTLAAEARARSIARRSRAKVG